MHQHSLASLPLFSCQSLHTQARVRTQTHTHARAHTRAQHTHTKSFVSPSLICLMILLPSFFLPPFSLLLLCAHWTEQSVVGLRQRRKDKTRRETVNRTEEEKMDPANELKEWQKRGLHSGRDENGEQTGRRLPSLFLSNDSLHLSFLTLSFAGGLPSSILNSWSSLVTLFLPLLPTEPPPLVEKVKRRGGADLSCSPSSPTGPGKKER